MSKIDLCPRPLAINLQVSCGDYSYSGKIPMSARGGCQCNHGADLSAVALKIARGRDQEKFLDEKYGMGGWVYTK